ncbi:MAG: peptidoglycan DD-metalloendopeptidase family protein [Eubacterium sp.]|jgi:murein DD-endopeptidase MepM/ murein hydrolase activator NlpD|nr:peptidoglycan DD-metalloendopeptidase family protein [Eubacterium sp.]
MENELLDKAVDTYITIKIIKKVVKVISKIFASTGFIIILLIIMTVVIVVSGNNFSESVVYTTFSPSVEQYRSIVQNYCKQENIEYYTDVVLAIMQVTSSGEGEDVMQSSNKEYNTLYGKEDDDITNAQYSIECGVKEIKTLIEMCNVQDLYDTANLQIMYQAYEYNRGYVAYAYENGGYSSDSAYTYAADNGITNRNEDFAINVSMYIDILTGGIREFADPLAIYSIIKDYSDDYKCRLYKGVRKQPVLSASSGLVTHIEDGADYSRIDVSYLDYVIHYNYVSDVSVEEGQEVTKGSKIGTVTFDNENDCYVLEFSIELAGEYVNPNDYLNKLVIDKQELDDQTVQQGIDVSAYSKTLIDNIAYLEGGSDINGCDRIGFIKAVYCAYNNNENTEYASMPTDYEELISSSLVSYKLDEAVYIRPQIMYEGDVIIYKDENGNYSNAGIYVGNSRIVHMTENGAVMSFYNFEEAAVLLRFAGHTESGMLWPLPGYTRANISSEFAPNRINPVTGVNESHNGTDIAAPTGTQVVAAKAGTVIEANYNNGAGYHIVIDHGDGVKTYYFHSSQLIANEGDEVKAGDVIMLVGSTGQSTGPHLHFGITINGEWVNAMDYSYINEEN